jgi:Tfp pilus assembly protein PilX
MRRLIRNEKGYILLLALLVLLVVGLISGPLLSYMVSGLRAGHTFETGAAELYAADAGVEDAVWRIPNVGLCPGYPSTTYNITDVNGKSVEVQNRRLHYR